MLEKPDLPEDLIISNFQREFGWTVSQITFLPLGYDVHTAIYRITTIDGTGYFVKLRKGRFDEATVLLTQFLKSQGNPAIIAPVKTRTGKLWSEMGAYKLIVYPFLEGKNGYEAPLSRRQWLAFGAALKRTHTVTLPPDLQALIPLETYPDAWRKMVTTYQAQVEVDSFKEPVAAKLAGFMRSRRSEISGIVQRASELARVLQTRSSETVLCHSDLHPGNLHISAEGPVYIAHRRVQEKKRAFIRATDRYR